MGGCIYGVDPTTPEDQNDGNGTVLPTTYFNFTGNIHNVNYNMNPNSGYGYANVNSAIGLQNGNELLQIGALFAEPGTNSSSLRIVFHKEVGPGGYTTAELYDLFSLENKKFNFPGGIEPEGVHLEFVDENGELWATYLGSGDQEVSDVRVLARGEMEGVDRVFYADIRFNCTVYNELGSEMRISSARWKGSFKATI